MTTRFIPRPSRPVFTAIAVCAVLLPALSGRARATTPSVLGTDVPARGAFTCDFRLPADFPLDAIAPTIERDRIYMARRPGMLYKHLPFRPDPANNTVRSGGRYLFDTYGNARDYKSWVTNEFVLDGTHFFDRPYFLEPDCHAWETIAAHDFADVHDSRVVMRTERWRTPDGNHRDTLERAWPAIRDEAATRGLSSAWLLYSHPERLATLVYYANRLIPGDQLDASAFAALETAPPLGAHLDALGWHKTMDLTEWVLTIWFPNTETGDNGEASLWPNSPPFPEPTPTDGVCEPSRGENGSTAPNDCTRDCGDGDWDTGEDNRRCPSDVPAS